MKHGRIVRETPQGDGTMLIRTEGYFDSLNSIKEEIRVNINTTPETLMQDVIKAMETITLTDCPEMTLTIKKFENEPKKIVKTYVTYKKKI